MLVPLGAFCKEVGISDDVIEKGERIYLGVANGMKSCALLCCTFNNQTFEISVGQQKAMLDLRFAWDDGPPILLFCSSGEKHLSSEPRYFTVFQLYLKMSSRVLSQLSRTELSLETRSYHEGAVMRSSTWTKSYANFSPCCCEANAPASGYRDVSPAI